MLSRCSTIGSSTLGRISLRTKRSYSFSNGLLSELEERGFVSQVTRPEILRDFLESGDVRTVYAGIDPTGKSLHVGHILPMMSLVHFQTRGHNIIPLIGGATARIGDPSGRLTERPQMELWRVGENIVKLTASVELFFQRALSYADTRISGTSSSCLPPRVMNNMQWFESFSFLDFLRVVGSQARVNSMLARESVQSRLDSHQGISFSEFSYQLLQAYDFLTLYQKENCTVQIGGSDQWGNIVAGIDLISRMNGTLDENNTSAQKGFGITTPLLTSATGEKFGKSAGNAIWLDATMTSVLDFYQFFLRTSDEDVERFLKLFTLLPLQEIKQVILKQNQQPESRIAQKVLADEVTTLVHSADGLRRAREATRVLFNTDCSDINAVDVIAALSNDPRLHYVPSDEALLVPIARLAVKFGLCKSFGAAKNLVRMGGLYLNGLPVSLDQKASQTDFLGERLLILRAGRANHIVLALL